ncbi:MAG: AAA family ATPase [Rhodothermaceae bacterium]|nr:AAA family ATPase [Rhodothermaceae bacterium]MYE62411.1 AAA family ATPase [Rhodothermaceae bacterium]MYJ21125.1 AAA family ATPase [Rhodothermaceae bacterium]
MPEIRKIAHLNHPGPLCDFKWPKETEGLSPFADYNLIYGANGSGKTTISSIFRDLEKSQLPHKDVEVVLEIDDNLVSGEEFPNHSNLSIRVFNRDFISENVFPATQEKGMPLILVLGEESAEKQKELEDLRRQQSRIGSKLGATKGSLVQASRDFAQHCTNGATNIRDSLLEYAPERYRKYDKRDYEKVAREMIRSESAEGQILDISESARLHNLLGENLKSPIRQVTRPDFSVPSILKQVEITLDRTVISSVLRSLKEDALLASWVGDGLSLYRERNSEVCLFCEQSIPEERLEELEKHFSDEHDRFVQEIRHLITQLEESKGEIDKVHLPRQQDFYREFKDEFDLTRAAFLNLRREWNDFLGKLIRQLEEKRVQPFQKIKLEVEVPESLESAIASVNEVIDKHNSVHRNFEARKTEAILRLESGLISENLDEFQNLVTEKEGFDIQVSNLEAQLANLTSDIERVENIILEYRTPSEEINYELHRYLGHNELRLEAKETGYYLMRSHGPADDISEGEKTALALLYFLKTLKHREFRLEEGIVVLDDPVSSLDSNALYLAFGYIKERTKDAGQLFVLTHNFTFFRQVKNWFVHHEKRKKQSHSRSVQFYMLEHIAQNGPRQTKLKELDPLLKDYENEYHYLFAQVYRRVNESQAVSMGHDYGLANVARRLLEVFFAFERPGSSFYKRITSSPFDGAKMNRILRFTNTYSHSNSTGEAGHDASVLLETKPILEDVLELIKSENKKHYSQMVKNIEESHQTKL